MHPLRLLLCTCACLFAVADEESLCPVDTSIAEPASGSDAGDDSGNCSASTLRSLPSDAQCIFVRSSCGDTGFGFFGSYLELFYCAGGGGSAVGVVGLLLLTCFLILVLGTTADNWFVPQLEYLAELLRLPPDVAGITLLALGNGAPDIFTAMAVAQDADTDFPMLLADLLGASVFISTVVLGSVALVASRRHRQWQVDVTPFWRDLCVYIVALSTVLAIAADGTIVLGEVLAFLCLYVAYITAVLLLPRLSAWCTHATPTPSPRNSALLASASDPVNAIAEPEADPTPPMPRGAGTPPPEHHHGALIGHPGESLMASTATANLADFKTRVPPLAALSWPDGLSSRPPWRRAWIVGLWAVEWPLSLARWLSIPSSDGAWDRRRKLLSAASLPGAALVLSLEVTNLIGGDAADAFSYTVGPLPVWLLAVAIAAPFSALVLRCDDDTPPSCYPALVTVGFVAVVAWLDLVANEVVAIIQTIGLLLGLSTSILGLTVVAIGNSVGDLVADTAVARRGDVRMAVASCFGSPLLNDIIGLGLALTVHTSLYGDIPSPISKQCRVAYLFLYPALLSSLLIFPAGGYSVGPRYALYLVCLYCLFMLASVLVEVGVVPDGLLCWWG